MVSSAAFSPEGRWVVTTSWNTAQVWEAQSGKPVSPPLQHEGLVSSAAFSPDGRWVVTARVWEAQTGRSVSPPLRHWWTVGFAAFSPDGRWVVTASEVLAARVWEAHTSRVGGADWLPRLAEAAGGLEVNDVEDFRAVAGLTRGVRSQVATNAATDDVSVWARWFVSDPHSRTINSSSKVTVPEYVDACLKEFTLAGANRAADLEPANGLVQARLAAATLKELVQARLEATTLKELTNKAICQARAEFLSRHALKLAPERTEVWRVRAEVLRATGDTTNAVQALERAVQFADREVPPWRPLLWKTLADFAQADGRPEPWLGLLESATRRGLADPELVQAKDKVEALGRKH